jgi:Tol biopolymer transport system component
LKKITAVLIWFTLLASILNTEEFGKNKIQYKNFDWKTIKTPHFTIYFYQGEEELVKFAAQVAEDSYLQLKRDLNHNFKQRMPLIIYNSHNDFEQTNVITSLIEESVGGFTELYKNRMVIPFEGSYESFRHVINHELVHVFQFDILFGSKIANVMQSELLSSIPLWVMEGLAEYESLNWNSETESYIRDAVINNRLLPIEQLNYSYSYASYKEGQSIYRYIGETYGKEKIGEFFHTLKLKKDFRKALKKTIGLSIEQLNEDWSRSLKKRYWPLYDEKDELDNIARRLTDHEKEGNAYNISPSISPDGTKIVYITNKETYFEIWIISSISGKPLKKIIRATRTASFENLHTMRPGLCWSPDGKKIAFSAKSAEDDIIYIVDAENGDITSELKPELDGIYSPNFSPDGKTIAFDGIKDGFSDIYTMDLKTKKLKKLTSDIHDDRNPVFSPSGEYIIFSSDRENKADTLWCYGNYALFRMDKNGDNLERLTERGYNVNSPTFSQNGDKIIYTSDREGVNNLYVLEIDNLNVYRLSDVFGGISSPSLSADSRKLAFAGYENGGWDIYVMRNPFDYPLVEPEEGVDHNTRYTTVNSNYEIENKKKAGLNFSTDWAGGYLVFASGYGFRSLMEIALSDVLGNNRFYFAFDLYSRNLLDSNFQLVYWFLPKRWDLGAAIFQEKNYYLIFPTEEQNIIEYIEETLRGVSTLLRLPIDKFHRFDIGTDIFSIDQYYEWVDENNNYGTYQTKPHYVLIPSISWVRDTSLWGYTGPIDGQRWKFSFAKSIPQISKYSYDYSMAYGDIRNYKKIGHDFSFATRIFGFGSWGEDALYYPLGGSEDVRGYDYYSFLGKKAGFVNLELRYPFIERLKFNFPLPLDIRGVRGVSFLDIGGVTDELRHFKTAVKYDGKPKLEDLKVGFGTGIRMDLSIAILKYDIAWHTNLQSVSHMYMHFSLGEEF